MSLLALIPAIPVRNIKESLIFYRDKLEFDCVYQDDNYVVLDQDDVTVHLWLANDNRWQGDTRSNPVVSGTESFLPGTCSFRIQVSDIDDAYETLSDYDIFHPNAPLESKPWGSREFGVLDPFGNLIIYFQWLK